MEVGVRLLWTLASARADPRNPTGGLPLEAEFALKRRPSPALVLLLLALVEQTRQRLRLTQLRGAAHVLHQHLAVVYHPQCLHF